MTRVKRGSVAVKRRKKVIKLTKGFKGSHSKLFASANQQMMKALRYSYIDRRQRKREFRSLWIRRINAASRQIEPTVLSGSKSSLSYSRLINMLGSTNNNLNRKVISQLAVLDPVCFQELVIEVSDRHSKP
jgi:large subunit ribosomal protein L20